MQPAPTTRRIAAGVMIALSLALWLFPSNVAKLIASHQPVVLGRYSDGYFVTLLLATILLWTTAWRVVFPSSRPAKEQSFRVIAVILGTLVGLVTIDTLWRGAGAPLYVEEGKLWPAVPGLREDEATHVTLRRPPNTHYQATCADEPPAARSYPHPAPGHLPVRVELTTDALGFRNGLPRDRYDIVTLGDSFTEGFCVDDAEPWPRLLAETTSQSVYNLGITGSYPVHYLAALELFGFSRQPAVVVCMVYEGNDFALAPRAAFDPLQRVHTSPLRLELKRRLLASLGGINAQGSIANEESINWLPLTLPAGSAGKAYAFPVDMLVQLYQTKEALQATPGWVEATAALDRIIEQCRARRIRLIIAFAPSKAHVVLPLARDVVAAESLRAFAALRRKGLPPAPVFEAELYDRLDTTELLLAEHLAARGAELVSPTVALRQAIAEGQQAYYTYDAHWTAEGHRVVADVIAKAIVHGHGSP